MHPRIAHHSLRAAESYRDSSSRRSPLYGATSGLSTACNGRRLRTSEWHRVWHPPRNGGGKLSGERLRQSALQGGICAALAKDLVDDARERLRGVDDRRVLREGFL